MPENPKPSNGIGFVGALQLLFIGLKLGGVITWPWWCVFLPFIGCASVGLLAIGLYFFCLFMASRYK